MSWANKNLNFSASNDIDGVGCDGHCTVIHLDSYGKPQNYFFSNSKKYWLKNYKNNKRTRVNLHGKYLPTNWNPALFLRKYGKETFQHVEHIRKGWGVGHGASSKGHYKKCKIEGHHACLEQWVPDGNLQFKEFGKKRRRKRGAKSMGSG